MSKHFQVKKHMGTTHIQSKIQFDQISGKHKLPHNILFQIILIGKIIKTITILMFVNTKCWKEFR